MEPINIDNYELYLSMQMDGELNEAQEAALAEFLNAHPELGSDVDVFTSIRFTPDTSVVFENKDSLLREERKVIGFLPTYKRSLAIAAALLLVVSLVGIWMNNQGGESNGLVSTRAQQQPLASSDIVNTVSVKENLAKQESVENPAVNDIIGTSQKPVGSTLASSRNQGVIAGKQTKKSAPSNQVSAEAVESARSVAVLEKAASAKPAMLPVYVNSIASTTTGAISIVEVERPLNESASNGYYVDEDKRGRMLAITKTLNNGVSKFQSIKESIHGQSLTFGVRDKKVKVIF